MTPVTIRWIPDRRLLTVASGDDTVTIELGRNETDAINTVRGISQTLHHIEDRMCGLADQLLDVAHPERLDLIIERMTCSACGRVFDVSNDADRGVCVSCGESTERYAGGLLVPQTQMEVA